MRTFILTATVAALTLSAASWANAQQREALTKQLDIMASIINTAIGHQQGDDRKRSWAERSPLESTYLAGQGVVYRVNFGSRMQRFGMSTAPMPPMPPMEKLELIQIDRRGPRVEKVIEIDDGEQREVEVIIDSHEVRIEGDEIHFEDGVTFSDELRQAVSTMRDAAEEMRDARRVIRDLSRVDKEASESARKQSAQQLAEAKMKLEQAQQRMQSARAELRQAQGQIEQRTSARMEEMQQARAARVASFEQTFVQTLCDYGSTLRDLPNNEHISLVIIGAGEQDNDKIHVFAKKDVMNCKGEKGASDLLSKAITYSF